MKLLGRVRRVAGLGVTSLGVLLTSSARADLYHYKNILIGERAAGLGGAYNAISDDPSGMYYNPAGILYSVENYFSLSANAYNVSQRTYKNIVPGQDYTYTSSGLIPTFFGFIQGGGKSKWGFAIVVDNYDQIDQDDVLTNIFSATDTTNTLYRRYLENDSTYLIGPSWATELRKDLTFGISLLGIFRSARSTDNTVSLLNPVGTGKLGIYNIQSAKTGYGLAPKIGVQWMPNTKTVLGWTLSKRVYLSGSGTEKKYLKLTSATSGTQTDLTQSTRSISYETPSPLTTSVGCAYYFSKKFLLAGDFDYYFEQADYALYKVQATWNASLGVEWYFENSMALRGALFTNNANTPTIDASVSGGGQNEKVDMLGVSAAVSILKPGSSLTIGMAYQMGSGQGQGLAGSSNIQTVSSSSITGYLMGSYQL